MGYYGLNHLGWLYRLAPGGQDLLPGLLSDHAALESMEEGRLVWAAHPAAAWLPAQRIPVLLLPNGPCHRRHPPAAGNAGGVHPSASRVAVSGPAKAPHPYRLWDAARRSREEGYLAEARTHGEQRDESDLAGGGYERVALSVMRALSGRRDRPIDSERAQLAGVPCRACCRGGRARVAGGRRRRGSLRGNARRRVAACASTAGRAVPHADAARQGGGAAHHPRSGAWRARGCRSGLRGASAGRIRRSWADNCCTGYEAAFPELGQLWGPTASGT